MRGARRSRTTLAFALALCVSAAADYYSDLGVRRSATVDEIKAAYRAKAKQFHPDKSDDPNAAEKFAAIAQAYETLSDAETRRQYDAYGPEYANRAPPRGGRGGSAHQRVDPFEEMMFGRQFGGGAYGRGGRPSYRPIFSQTVDLDYRNWDLLVGARESGPGGPQRRLWLVLFYSDSSDQSVRFAPEWEALAERMYPMIRLGRVNTNGRTNWEILRRYRSIVHRLPTVVMVGDEGGDAARATAYYGAQLSAEAVGEWSRRFFPSARVSRIANGRFLRDFLRRHGSRTGSPADERTPVVVLSSHPSGDSLLFRYVSHRFVGGSAEGGVAAGNGGVRYVLGHVHVSGGVGGRSAGSEVARELGARELPSVAVWRDGVGQPPDVIPLSSGHDPALDEAAAGLSAEAAVRVRLVTLLEGRAGPRVPLLRASNVHRLCVRAVRGAHGAHGCALLLCDNPAGARCAAALALVREAEAEARADARGAEPRVRWAVVDGARQAPLVRALLGSGGAGGGAGGSRAGARPAGARPAAATPPLPAIALLLPAADGLAAARWAVYPEPLPTLTPPSGAARALLGWADGVLGGTVRAARGSSELPPLLADAPPSIFARGYALLFGELLPFQQRLALYLTLPVGVALLAFLLRGAWAQGEGSAAGGGAGAQGASAEGRAAGANGRAGGAADARGGASGARSRDDGRSRDSSAHPEPGAEGAGRGGERRRPDGSGAQQRGSARHAHYDDASSSFSGSASGSFHNGRGRAEEPSGADEGAGSVLRLHAGGVATALSLAPFLVLLPIGSNIYTSKRCLATAQTLASHRYRGSRRFVFAVVDLGEPDGGNPIFHRVQAVLRRCGCIALRRASDIERTRGAYYTGPMSPDELGEWLERLVVGEITFFSLLDG